MAPRMARTSFASCEGGSCRCMPRTVPRRSLRETLVCTHAVCRPWLANSSAHHRRAKNPRASVCASISTTNAPASGVSTKRMSSRPVEFLVYLAARLQVLELLQARERAERVGLRLHLNALEQLAQLPGPVARGEAAAEAGKLTVDAIEVHAIAARVAARRSHGDLAARKLFRNDLRELADAIVVAVLA